jgi:hypothetical protein
MNNNKKVDMTSLVKQDQANELDYFRSLVQIAQKSGAYGSMTPETMLNIMLTAKDFGISPMKALNNGFYVVKGKISMSTDLMVDRIRKDGHSIKVPEWTSEKCVVIGVRKDNGDSIKFEFTIEDAQRAGLTNSPTWKSFPKHMLYKRAVATLARTLFPDVVGNAYSEDEKHDITNTPPPQRPLEDPDCITVEQAPSAKITLEQANILVDLIRETQVDVEQFLAWMKVERLIDIEQNQYERAFNALNNKKKIIQMPKETTHEADKS